MIDERYERCGIKTIDVVKTDTVILGNEQPTLFLVLFTSAGDKIFTAFFEDRHLMMRGQVRIALNYDTEFNAYVCYILEGKRKVEMREAA